MNSIEAMKVKKNTATGQSTSGQHSQKAGEIGKPTEKPKAGQPWAAQMFLFSLLFPFPIEIGTLLLMPHRTVLLFLFFPFVWKLFVSRTAGQVRAIDWLLFGSAIWAGPSLLWNHTAGSAAEPFGIHLLEFFGAYLVARVSIRSASDFEKMVKLLFFITLFLLPFAALESITRKPILLNLIPNSGIGAVDAGMRLGLRRAQTIFSHPILFGVFVSTGMGLFWYSIRPRWLKYPSVPIVAAATFFSLSTGALLSIVIQSTLISWEFIMKRIISRWRVFAILCIAGYVTIDILSNRSPFHVLVTYGTFSTGSAYNRILIWQYGLENVKANPLFGLGMNDWSRPSWMSSSADNFWLLLAMRYGLPTILMITIAISLIFRQVGRVPLSRENDSLARAAYLVSIGGLVVAGGTVHYWHAMMAFVMFIFGSGIWMISGGALESGANSIQRSLESADRPTYSRRHIGFVKPDVEESSLKGPPRRA